MNPETKEFYSSKPPLLATMLAGEYWLLKRAFGWDIVRDRWLVIPAIVLTVNVIPFAVYLVLLARLIDATGKTDFGKLLAFTTAAVGTFLITFAGTLNNHTPAAFCVLFAVYPLFGRYAENRDMTPRGLPGAAASSRRSRRRSSCPRSRSSRRSGVPLLIARARRRCSSSCRGARADPRALRVQLRGARARCSRRTASSAGRGTTSRGATGRSGAHRPAKGIDFNEEPTASTRSTCCSGTTAGSA